MNGTNHSFDAEFDDFEDFQRRLVAGSFRKVYADFERSHDAARGPADRLPMALKRRRRWW